MNTDKILLKMLSKTLNLFVNKDCKKTCKINFHAETMDCIKCSIKLDKKYIVYLFVVSVFFLLRPNVRFSRDQIIRIGDNSRQPQSLPFKGLRFVFIFIWFI